MSSDIQKAAERFMSGEDGKRLSGKRADIERLAGSRDGEQVKALLQQGGFEDAVRRGDASAMRDAISGALKTESGARLVKSLQELMGKK